MRRADILWRAVVGLACGLLMTTAPAQTPATSGLDRQEIRAQLRPIRYTTLSAEIGAVVHSLLVREGQRFAAGAPLVKLDCGLHDAQAAKSRAELAGAQRSLEANQRLAELNAAGLM